MGTLGMVMAAMAAMVPANDVQPITLLTEATATGVIVRVVGGTSARIQAAYTLDVSSGVDGSNHTVQSGTARLEAGTRVVLLTTHLGGSAGANWKARLSVYPTGQSEYEIVKQAD